MVWFKSGAGTGFGFYCPIFRMAGKAGTLLRLPKPLQNQVCYHKMGMWEGVHTVSPDQRSGRIGRLQPLGHLHQRRMQVNKPKPVFRAELFYEFTQFGQPVVTAVQVFRLYSDILVIQRGRQHGNIPHPTILKLLYQKPQVLFIVLDRPALFFPIRPHTVQGAPDVVHPIHHKSLIGLLRRNVPIQLPQAPGDTTAWDTKIIALYAFVRIARGKKVKQIANKAAVCGNAVANKGDSVAIFYIHAPTPVQTLRRCPGHPAVQRTGR